MTSKPRWIVEAESLLGEKEIKGKLANEKIKELYADAGHPEVISDEVPWCKAFVSACLARSNQAFDSSLLALDTLKRKDIFDITKKPVLYSMGVMTRGNSGWEGHVGFVTKWNDTHVWLLGGNQADSVNVTPYPRSKFKGFAYPKEKTMDLPVAALVKDSRRLKTQTWFERMYVAGTGMLAAVWAMWRDLLEIAQQNMGWVLLGFLGVGYLGLRVLKYMSVREYREGRYLPKKQWD